MNVLAEALDDLRDKLYGVKDIGFTGESKDICQYAADLLGPSMQSECLDVTFFITILPISLSDMITVEKRGAQLFFKPVTQIPNVIELSYYSNSLVPHFALESIMITALNTLAKELEKKFPTKVSCKFVGILMQHRLIVVVSL